MNAFAIGLVGVAGLAAVFVSRRAVAASVVTPSVGKVTTIPQGQSVPRGIRNNNPGNIEYQTANQWRGQTGSDGRYAIFESPHYGLRAMALLLRRYIYDYELNTIRDLINRWAPATENLTGEYIKSVSEFTKIGPDEVLFFSSDAAPIMKAIVRHENGQQPYSDAQFSAALRDI